MKNKSIPLKWYLFASLLLLGVILRFFCPGYTFSGFFLIAVSALIPITRLITFVPHTKWRKGLLMLETIFLSILAVAMAVTCCFIIRSSYGTDAPDSKYLIVLGAGVNGDVPSRSLQDRIDAAVQYMNTHPDAVAIVSGGQGDGENITEAQCMYQEMVSAGIAPERIWMEPKATSTLENLRYSLDVIKENTGSLPQKVAVVSSEYHLHRAAIFARRLGVEPELVPAITPNIALRSNYYLREIFAVWYYSILGGY